MSFYEFHYTSVGELQSMIRRTLEKHKEYEPVCPAPKSRKICTSWWGDAWCRNLERYADWTNRIGRGKSYVRNGAVLDLKIDGGTIRAKVQGSRSKPYDVAITIAPLPAKRRKEIERQAAGKIEDLESLTSGKFPEEMKELFFEKGGLFPEPKEIKFAEFEASYEKNEIKAIHEVLGSGTFYGLYTSSEAELKNLPPRSLEAVFLI